MNVWKLVSATDTEVGISNFFKTTNSIIINPEFWLMDCKNALGFYVYIQLNGDKVVETRCT